MPLPTDVDQRIRYRFDELIQEGLELVTKMEIYNQDRHREDSGSSIIIFGEIPGHTMEYNSLVVRTCNLIRTLFQNSREGEEHKQMIRRLDTGSYSVEVIVGILHGLKSDYEMGFYDDLEQRVVSDI